MSIKSRDVLKALFETGDKPSQQDFHDFLDSVRLKTEIISVNDVSSAYDSIVLTDGDTINWDALTGNIATLSIATGDGGKTLNITNLTANRFYMLFLQRGDSGVVTLALPANHYVANGGGGSVTLSTMNGARDTLCGFYNGTETRWTFTKNFS